ncbi:hypothetical protein IGI04_039996 [Brassica rapa subsp. trilocularis]|uniref:Retrotransposon gag domain-containing protein n=1 Tax=Brassica rapa subsp. trilocularis TaxID=1813537 RepID=A0ABQ7KPF0_BRACM|nr:hypothetical protein IGI04_039996 [Brassica rapa subsp. trilocularis]
MPYLTNQEGVQANWNWVKIITEREVMNFTIQRFLNPSICEYPTLEEDSSSMKERPEAKPITEVKRSLSSFHKAQDQEKWPRKLGVMINSPEPAKPTSSMESLQPIQLGSTQSYLWEPGDHLNQSGGEPDDVQTEPRHPGDIIHEPEEFYNFIPCTSPHRNKKIPIITKLPYLESLAFKLQQLFFYQGKDEISFYQAFKKVQNRPSPSPSRPSSHSIAVRPSCPVRVLEPQSVHLSSLNPSLQHLVSELKLLTQLEKRNKAQGQRPQQGKRRFGDAPEDGYVEPKPPDPSWITPHHTSSTHKHLTHSYLDFKPVNEVKIYSFSGSSWPDDYLSWERTMDDWFSFHGVPKKEKLSHAIKQLNGSAYKWWKGVDGARWKSQREAIKTWEDLKEAMIRKYVSSLPTPEIRERYPRRFSSHGSKEAKRVVPQQGHRSLIHQEQIRPNKGHTVLYDQSQPYEVPKTMERKNFVSQDTLARHKEKSDKPIFQEKAKVSPILDKFVYKSSPTGMSHLSLSKDVKTGPEIQKDTNSTSLLRSKEKVQDTMQSMLLKEAKPVNKVSNQESKNESYLLPEVLRKEPDHKPSHEPPHKWKSSVEQCVQMPRLKVIFSDLKTSKTLDYPDIMHLSLPKSFDPGIKEVEVHNHQGQKMQRRQQTRTSCPKKKIILQLVEAIKNVENFSGCKGESFKEIPPDNLLLLGESKPKMVRTEPTRKVDPTPYSTSQGANQDIRALKMPYLTNQEGLNHEANFYAFYTQEGVQANWNWVKIITEREVMNFTIQRFLNPSICEYPTLEEDSSSMKERPEAKPITEVKRSLSSFHKAQDQEKWPRKLGVMINSPEPAKPTSSMESLQPIQLGSTQSYLWEPGDHLNQSGGIPEVLSCTRTQEISWFNGESLKPNRSYLWKDWTIFRFDPFQAIPIQPGEPDDVQTEPRHPGDIIHEPEEFYNFIPCTSPHRNKKIPIITKLPYLESLAFKLQQLFFYQGKDEISFYQAFKKVPRKLSYPLKPSRFKQIKFLHLEPKSHKRLQRLVSDFLLSLDLFPFFSFVNV